MRAELENEPKITRKLPFVGDLTVERNKLTGKLMRAQMKGDKKKAAEYQVG